VGVHQAGWLQAGLRHRQASRLFKEHGLPEPESPADDIRQRLAALEASADPASELEAIRTDLAALEARLAATPGAKVS
jgi:hypothetical protein